MELLPFAVFALTRYIDGLVQDCGNSSALAMELLWSCTKRWYMIYRQREIVYVYWKSMSVNPTYKALSSITWGTSDKHWWSSYIIMVVADGLAPNRCQVISNHHDDIIISQDSYNAAYVLQPTNTPCWFSQEVDNPLVYFFLEEGWDSYSNNFLWSSFTCFHSGWFSYMKRSVEKHMSLIIDPRGHHTFLT